MSTRFKVLVSVAAISGTAAVAGLGTFGTFTSTTAAQAQTDATGTVTLDYGANGTTNRLTTGASNLAAGDTIARMFTLRNSGTINLASVVMDVAASPSSALDTDATNGLTVKLDKCSVALVEVGTTAPFTYTCAGTVSSVLASTPIATAKSTPPSLSGLSSLTSGSSDNLVMTVTLPSGAPNSMEGLSSTLSFDFVGTQRAATSQ